MSTVTITEPLASPGAIGQPLSAGDTRLQNSVVSPVEYVKSLSPDAKQDVLVALLRELIEYYGGKGLIPFDLPGESLGYYVPPVAAKERYELMLAQLPPEEREQLQKPLPSDFDPEDCLTDEEFQALNREIDESVLRQSQSS